MTFVLGATFLAALLSSIGFTWAVRKVAVARGWSGPTSAHHVHDGPVPRVGGIGVFCAMLFSVAVAIIVSRAAASTVAIAAFKVVVAAGIVFMAGLYDDFHPIRPRFKLLFECIAGSILVFSGIRIDHLPLFGPLPTLVALPLTLLVVVGITNAFNLIDGLDGLAAGTAGVSAAVFLVLSVARGDWMVALVAASLLGAVVGFLRFNLHPASIFLGDCGSLLIGFLISMCAISVVRETKTPYMIAVPMLAVGLPLMDTLLAIIRRYLKRQHIFVPDQEHMHHKLLKRGHSHGSAVLVLYGVSAFFGWVSVALAMWQTFAPVLFVLCGAASAMVVTYLGYHRSLRWSRSVQPAVEIGDAPATDFSLRGATVRLNEVQTLPELQGLLDSTLSTGRFSGYELLIPAPLAGVDLRGWGFLLDATGKHYMWHYHNGNGTGNGTDHYKEGESGESERTQRITVELASPRVPGNLLTIYFSTPIAGHSELLPAAFSGALSEAVARVLAAARQQKGKSKPTAFGPGGFDSRASLDLSHDQIRISGSAD